MYSPLTTGAPPQELPSYTSEPQLEQLLPRRNHDQQPVLLAITLATASTKKSLFMASVSFSRSNNHGEAVSQQTLPHTL
jgi:hypothetical protein